MKMFSVYDQESKTYLKPFFFLTERDAKEGFKNVCQDPETQYAKYPSDYNLVHLGEFDIKSGVTTLLPEANVIGRAIHFVKSDSVEGGKDE